MELFPRSRVPRLASFSTETSHEVRKEFPDLQSCPPGGGVLCAIATGRCALVPRAFVTSALVSYAVYIARRLSVLDLGAPCLCTVSLALFRSVFCLSALVGVYFWKCTCVDVFVSKSYMRMYAQRTYPHGIRVCLFCFVRRILVVDRHS